jgi:acetyltransferase-like isoleucine patch superfamily enzyme
MKFVKGEKMNVSLVLNFFRVLFLKFQYGERLKIHWVQLLGKHTSILIKGKSLVCMGKAITSRSNLNIKVENARLIISNSVFFNHNCSITALESIEIGEGSSFGNNVVIVDHDHSKSGTGFITSEIKIGNNVWVGANSVILRGTIIGDNCIIAAGSIVTGEIEENTLVYQKRNTELKKIRTKLRGTT